jgi:hypothetical protein
LTTPILRPELVPTTASIHGWIEAVVGFGIRRPGWAGDHATEQWAGRQFQRLGLQDVRLEPVQMPVWTSDHATLTAWSTHDPVRRETFQGMALPHTAGGDGHERRLVRGADNAAAADAIVVEPLVLAQITQEQVREIGTSVYDPDGDFAQHTQTVPLSNRGALVLEPALEAGAAGFVGVLSGVPWDTCSYYLPYDTVLRPIPALWLSGHDGPRLDALLDAGPVTGRLDVDAQRTTGHGHNVIGTLPGRGDEWVVIASHHDAPWASAVEDGSGIALVLAQAAYWSAIEEQDRPHNLMFLLTAGHMAHAAGTASFITTHRELLERCVCEIHLEHAAAEVVGDGTNLHLTGRPEPRWWFTSRIAELEQAVLAAITAEDLRRSHVLPPEAFMVHPPTDGGFFHLEGIPLVNFLTSPMYLFDPADTLDKVHQPSLVPLTRATVRIINALAGRSAAEMRLATTAQGASA